ncbi:hypothetical protein ABVT39_007119 [Epinephelus coioides]
MASDASPPGDDEVKERRRRKRREREVRRKEVQDVDIEELTSAGHRALQEGRTEDALSYFNNALKAAGQLQDSRVVLACSFNLGAAYVEAGQPKKGLDLLCQAQPGPKADRLPDLQFNLALAHNALGQSQEASAYFLQAAQLYRSQGDGGSEGDACMEMSRCYSRAQDWSLAVQGFLRAAESYRVADMLDSAATALKEAGSHMLQSDQFSHDDIIGVLAECLSLTNNITNPRILGELYLSVGVSYCQLRCFQEAVQCFQQALGPTAQHPPLLAKVLHNLGAALNSLGQFTPAVEYHRLAAGLYGSLGYRGDQARCFSNLAFACSQLGDEEEAAESFLHALQGFRDTEDHMAQVQVCESLAECFLKQRKQHKAVQLYKQALTALSHCKDSSGDVRDRLVERLTAALQQSVQRPRPPRPHPFSPPVGQQIRKSDITQSPGRASKQQPDDQRGEGQGFFGVLCGFLNREHEEEKHSELLIRMSGNWSPSPNTSQFPPLTDWEAPTFTRAAQFRVGATFILFLFAACSNLALFASVWCGRGRRLASHLRPLMLSLASADLMMTFVVMPLDAVWNVTVQWYGGDVLCKLLCFLKLFAMHASAFILVVISLDRQHAILHPLDALNAHRRNRRMLLLAWSLSLVLASPQLFIFRTIRVEAVDFTQCATHGSFSHRWQETVYNMFHFITLYVVPLLVMSCCYSRILLHIHLQHLRDKGESYLRRSGTDIIPKARMKTLKMTVVIVLSFVVCWTPYYLLGIWYWFQPDMLRVTPEYVHHALFLFGNLNTCCDPVIYGFYTPSFRADLAACCRRTKSDASLRSPDRLSARQDPHSAEHEADPATNNQPAGD